MDLGYTVLAMSQDEVARWLAVLRTSLRMLGKTNREIEQKLGVSYGYLSRLFAGTLDLKVEHVLDITAAMGLHPAEFFHLLYPQVPARSSEAATKLRSALQGFQPTASATAPEPPRQQPSQEEIERMMLTSLRKLFAELGQGEKGR